MKPQLSLSPLGQTERAILAFVESKQGRGATTAEILRAVPEALPRRVAWLHRQRYLVSAPSPGRGNRMVSARQLAAALIVASVIRGLS